MGYQDTTITEGSIKMKKYLLSAIVCSLFGHIGVATATVPGQFIAKMYSEVLGRAPDTGGWNSAMQESAGFASGSIQAFTNSTVDDCISDNSQN
jgi:hypothetical protein